MFYYILFYFILFYSILFYSILFSFIHNSLGEWEWSINFMLFVNSLLAQADTVEERLDVRDLFYKFDLYTALEFLQEYAPIDDLQKQIEIFLEVIYKYWGEEIGGISSININIDLYLYNTNCVEERLDFRNLFRNKLIFFYFFFFYFFFFLFFILFFFFIFFFLFLFFFYFFFFYLGYEK